MKKEYSLTTSAPRRLLHHERCIQWRHVTYYPQDDILSSYLRDLIKSIATALSVPVIIIIIIIININNKYIRYNSNTADSVHFLGNYMDDSAAWQLMWSTEYATN